MKQWLKITIFIFIGLIFLNLLWTVSYLDNSPLLQISQDVLNEKTDRWALRGQIGDIMSGHFSALAVLSVALSILLQYEANNQMKNSLTVQAKSLDAQIEELKSASKESKRQTEEFFIQNMNTKMDRYYKLVDDIAKGLFSGDKVLDVSNALTKKRLGKPYDDELITNYTTHFPRVLKFLEHMFIDIRASKKHTTSYESLLREFRIKIHADVYLDTVCRGSIDTYSKSFQFLELYDENYNSVYIDTEDTYNKKYYQAQADL